MNKIPVLLALCLLWACIPTKKNSQARSAEKPYLVWVSLDGFRYDYETLHGAPNLAEIAREGVKAASMTPSYPASTFPNHYTLVTGMYPVHHGLVSNSFFDPERGEGYEMKNKKNVRDSSWYGGVPLWVLAEQQGFKAASYFWVGSEMGIQGVYPSYYYHYDGSVPNDDRVDEVIRWLKLPEAERPHFLTLYFSIVDDAGHSDGPEGEKTKQAVREADRLVGSLWAKLKELDLPVNLMVTSDHGMQLTDNAHPILLQEQVDMSGFHIKESSSTVIMLYAREGTREEDIQKLYQEIDALKEDRFEVFLRKDIPEYLHFNENARCGDILVKAIAPHVFGVGRYRPSLGCHGYDPYRTVDMGAIFYAWGPAFKEGMLLPPFENIHVYPLAAEILGMKYDAASIDGKLKVLQPCLQP